MMFQADECLAGLQLDSAPHSTKDAFELILFWQKKES